MSFYSPFFLLSTVQRKWVLIIFKQYYDIFFSTQNANPSNLHANMKKKLNRVFIFIFSFFLLLFFLPLFT